MGASKENLFKRLQDLNEIGIALSRRQDTRELLPRILDAAKRITHADAGTLYLLEPVQNVLTFEVVRNDTLNVGAGSSLSETTKIFPVRLYDEAGNPNNKMVVSHVALSGKTVNISDAYEAEGFDFSGTRTFDRRTGYRSKSMVAVPMRDHEGDIIGVLQLINAKHPDSGEIMSFSEDAQHLLESLASQAAISLTTQRLIKQLESLFESFISLINTAIDDKSPYTGGHCARVPKLTMLLADAVNRDKSGLFKDFHLSSRDLDELRIASLLHDCGKITTPVHVVDKATKLQTLFDRIEMVDTRFEVLKRDAEIEMLRAQLTLQGNPVEVAADTAQLKSDFKARIRQLDEDREFLRISNVGGERMSEADQARVQQIGAYRWRDVEGQDSPFLSEDEVKNLTIMAGTLTPEEREIINHHIVVTIKMLKSLPWPKHLKNVPEFAGGHHERMDGKGYPNGLTRDQMSIQARMMGIADIFEALTARDRPYKVGKSLSESLYILGKFKENGHIDPDLFDIFIRERVYEGYAQKFLDPSQRDEVDDSKIPGYGKK